MYIDIDIYTHAKLAFTIEQKTMLSKTHTNHKHLAIYDPYKIVSVA